MYRQWIEQSLGVPLSDVVIIEIEVDLTQIGVERILGVDGLESTPNRILRRLRTHVANVELPLDIPPAIEMLDRPVRDDSHDFLGGTMRRKNLRLEWGDSPIALRFHLAGTVMVAINVSYYDGPSTPYESKARLVVARRDCAKDAVGLISQIANKDRQPRIHVLDGSTRRITHCDWDDLILDQSVLSLVWDDFESFFERRAWYQRNKLPFRRGYLFHGPPGNGKTSVIRAMMSSKGLTAHTLRFFDPHKDDSDLDRLFEEAMKDCPSMILLEDVDRAFPKTGESKSCISLLQLLNCLDGVGTGNGVVVVATANEPTALDPAILRRPGRFDRVVLFANPDNELRSRYFLRFCPHIDPKELRKIVIECDGFSFAQLKESVVCAGNSAFQRKEDINPEDLLHGIRALRKSNLLVSEGSKSAGFGSTR